MAVETGKSKKKTAQIEIKEAKTDSYLSNMRTFLDWVRVSLASFVLGFIIARFGFWFDQLGQKGQISTKSPDNVMAMIIGSTIIGLGGVIAVFAVYHFRAVNKIIDEGGGSINTRLTTYIAIVCIAIAIILIIYLLLVFQTFK